MVNKWVDIRVERRHKKNVGYPHASRPLPFNIAYFNRKGTPLYTPLYNNILQIRNWPFFIILFGNLAFTCRKFLTVRSTSQRQVSFALILILSLAPFS